MQKGEDGEEEEIARYLPVVVDDDVGCRLSRKVNGLEHCSHRQRNANGSLAHHIAAIALITKEEPKHWCGMK